MYIEQVKNKNFNPLLYLPIPLGFMLLMIINYIFTRGMDINKVMKDSINQFGVNGTFIMAILPLSLGCLGVWFWVKFVHGQSITSLTTSRKKIDFNRIFFAFTFWAVVTIALTLSAYFNAPEDFVYNFKPEKFWIFLVLAVVLIPLQTSFEEYLFRAYTMQGLGVFTKSRAIPFVVTSVLFGLMHIANPEVGKLGYSIMIYYIGTGFFLGILTLMDEGLELALGFHAANNLVGALLVTSDWGAFQTHSILKDVSTPSAGFDIILPVFIIYPLLLYIFSKKYHWNWSQWKEKLFGTITFNEKIQYNDANL